MTIGMDSWNSNVRKIPVYEKWSNQEWLIESNQITLKFKNEKQEKFLSLEGIRNWDSCNMDGGQKSRVQCKLMTKVVFFLIYSFENI